MPINKLKGVFNKSKPINNQFEDYDEEWDEEESEEWDEEESEDWDEEDDSDEEWDEEESEGSDNLADDYEFQSEEFSEFDEYYDEEDNFDEEAYLEDEYDSDYEYNDDGELVRVRNTVTQSKLEEEREIQEYFKQGLTLDEIETIEYRKAKRQLIKATAEKKEQDRIDFFESFTQPKTIFGFFGFYLANFAYLFFLSNQFAYSLLLGAIGAWYLTKWFIYKEFQTDIRERELHDLEAVATEISFESQAGKNVYMTLETILSKDKYRGRVKADLDYTFNTLVTATVLDVTNFETYEFTPFNLFLRNVSIWYTEGVPVKHLFEKAINNINFELVNRDLLRNNLAKQLKTELVSVGIALAMPAAIRFAAPAQFAIAVGKPIPWAILITIFYAGQVATVISLKKKALNVAIR